MSRPFCAGARKENYMATIMIGSARINERGKLSGGVAGDQKQVSSANDTKGEVSMQPFYVHSKGWYILRPKNAALAAKMAERMTAACNNKNIGYDQGNRLGVIIYSINTKTKTECDCSSLTRQVVKEASGKDPGNFTTANAAAVLGATGLFMSKIAYVSQAKTPIYNGDILVTKTKGHIVVVVSGHPRSQTQNSGSGSSVAKGEYNVQTIRKGSKGKAVKIWQVILGYTGSKIDGIYGSGTEADTKTWQKAHGLTADGIVGTKSWKVGFESV